MKLVKYWLPVLFFIVSATTVMNAQFNLAVNYFLGYADTPNYNAIIENYNTTQPNTKFNLEEIGLLNGIGLGFRYRYRFVGLEFNWIERFKRSKAEGTDLEGELTFREIAYRYRSFGLGYTTFINDTWSFGGTINRDRFVLNTETNIDFIQPFSLQNTYSSRFFVGLTAKVSDAMSISLQPFVWVPWGEFDFSDLNTLLNPNTPLADGTENFFHFGIGLILYNGPQY